jgi:hypothetical protein
VGFLMRADRIAALKQQTPPLPFTSPKPGEGGLSSPNDLSPIA